ncbi:ferrochelatase [Alloyangia pacifica]|uniref:ferrochelatase n=1 Tax=Alloyangia pacifica TaxID=311180 RepID=UPI001CFC8626|nr:ferrochelatase [Alloyangia pacifica]
MKKFALAAAIAASATSALAGSYETAEPVAEPIVVVEEAPASSSYGGILIPLLLIAVVAAAASTD